MHDIEISEQPSASCLFLKSFLFEFGSDGVFDIAKFAQEEWQISFTQEDVELFNPDKINRVLTATLNLIPYFGEDKSICALIENMETETFRSFLIYKKNLRKTEGKLCRVRAKISQIKFNTVVELII